MMTAEIIQRLTALGAGGIENNKDDFQSFWQPIIWNQFVYPKDWDYYGLADFYQQHIELHQSAKKQFNDALIAHYFTPSENYFGQHVKTYDLFAPFNPSNTHFGSLDGLIEPEELKVLVDGNALAFIPVFETASFPNLYFVCASDPNPENPTLYSTDHETFFQEIEAEGNFADFLNHYLTKAEFLVYAEQYIQEIK